MERKCPKCGGKLGIFDLKPNCPHCGCSIMYYDMDKRLEEDSVKAEAEWQKLETTLDKITPAFIKKKRAAREEKEKNETHSARVVVPVDDGVHLGVAHKCVLVLKFLQSVA